MAQDIHTTQDKLCGHSNNRMTFDKIGHLNLFRLQPLPKEEKRSLPYRRRDFYKFMFVRGSVDFHYADRVVNIEKQALVFSNPQIPYAVKHLDKVIDGSYCIMSRKKFNDHSALQKYPVFTPQGHHIFELADDLAVEVEAIFEKMHEDLASTYEYKDDLIVNRILELMHFTMKLNPSIFLKDNKVNASNRITTVFLELLERQFPIDTDHPMIHFKLASEFANQLNVHVNHLNRAVKETMQKTTSQVINERKIKEAKIMLRQSDWSVKEIAFSLGFKEPSHFHNFFKKYVQESPLTFRKG